MAVDRGYTTLLFDFDHTLFDTDESERMAYDHTMETIGLEDAGAHFDRYVAINRAMWRAVEAGDLQPSEVRLRRFEQFSHEVGHDADPEVMAELFFHGLSRFGDLYDGARDVLETLAQRTCMAMVTNGLSFVQRTRIERLGLEPFFDAVVISEEVGVTKPRPEIFDRTFAALGGPDRATAVMIGDSLTSDIAGGTNAGIDTCWYNPHRTAPPGHASITHEIISLDELTRFA